VAAAGSVLAAPGDERPVGVEILERTRRGWLIFFERQGEYLKMRHDTP
jgi:hypothetical protein